MKRRALIVSVALAVATPAFAAETTTATQLLKAFTVQTRSAQGNFTQQILDKDGKSLEMPANGQFVFERPGKFAWKIVKPYPQSIVSDGSSLWIWDPDLNQVTVKKLNAAVSTTPAAVLFGTGNIEEFFTLVDEKTVDGIYWVKATPKVEDLTYSQIHIGFERSGVMSAMRLQDHFGQTTVLKFTDVKTQSKVAPETFAFKIPENADVLRDDN